MKLDAAPTVATIFVPSDDKAIDDQARLVSRAVQVLP